MRLRLPSLSAVRRGLLLAGLVVLAGVSCAEYVASPEAAGTRRVRSARLSQSEYAVDDGQALQLAVQLVDQFGVPFTEVPEGTTITWESGDPTRLTVDDNGRVTTLRAGVVGVAAIVRTLGVIRVTAPVTIRPVPAGLERSAGDAQSGPVGDPLPQALSVRVVDRRGDPIPDAEVRFTFDREAGTSQITTARTDATGIARATWTLAARIVGQQRAQASTPLLPAVTVAFTATARAGTPATVEAISGGGQTGGVDVTLPQPLVARVVDRFGNPVGGAVVGFTAGAGQGTVTPAQATADADGRASATWTLGPTPGPAQATATSGSAVPARFDATITTGPITQVALAPRSVALDALGATATITGTARDARGNAVANAVVLFRSSDPAVASVAANGTVTAVANGTARLIATVQEADPATVTDEIAVTVAQVPTTVVVSPTAVTLTAGATRAATAAVRDARGNAVAGATVTWSAADASVATVDAAGVITAVAPGTTTIRARSTVGSTTVEGTLSVTVNARVPASVVVSPASASIAAGATQAFTAVVRDAGGTAIPGATVTWSSSASAVATISTTGLATAVAAGTSIITATVGGTTPAVSGTATLTVTSAPSPTVSITPDPVAPITRLGGTVALTATVRDGQGTILPGATVTWASLDPAVATVSASGVVTAAATGSARITATYADVSPAVVATVVVPVTQVAASVVVSPTSASVGIGATQAFTAVVRDAGGTAIPGATVTWSSNATAVATVSTLGVASGVAAGSATITATVGGTTPALTADAALTVTAAPTASVTLAPDPVPSLTQLGATVPLTATVRDAGGTVIPGAEVTWTSLEPAVATVSATGVVTAVANGTARITATYGAVAPAVSATTIVTVAQRAATVDVTPLTASAVVGATQAFTAVVRDAGGAAIPGAGVTWTSSAAAVATVASTGVASAVSTGSATITATVVGTSPAITGTATLTVTAAPSAAITITPDPVPSIDRIGGTATLTAVVRDGDGAVIPGAAITWQSLDAGVATVSTDGVVTAVANGTARITATFAGVSPAVTATINVPVQQVAATVSVAPATVSIARDAITTLVATVRDAGGTTIAGAAVTWSSANTGIATVSPEGVVTGVAPGGPVAVTATVGSGASAVSGAASVTVTAAAGPPAAVELTLSPTDAVLAFGTAPVTATLIVRDADGAILDVTADLAVDRADIFGVQRTGPRSFLLARGNAFGAATITATAGTATTTATRTAMPLIAIRDDGAPDASCSVRNGRVFCVGRRAVGSTPDAGIADGTAANRVREAEVALPAGNFRQVGVGVGFACALDDLGRVFCWGANNAGQLGDGTTADRFLVPQPVSVAGPYIALDAGYEGYACALRIDGVLHCWGEGANGRLGVGDVSGRLVPTPVNTSDRFTSVSAGSSGACALATDGQGHCWGFGGTTGTGLGGDVLSPTPLATSVRFTQVVNGWFHGCGIAADGQAYCWGDQFVGQGGIGVVAGPQSAAQPVAVNGLTRYTELRAGGYFTCGRATSTAQWWCWGNDENGETGRGSVNGRTWEPTLATVLNARNPVRLGVVGDRYACAVDVAGERWCVGRNVALGTGVLVDPVAAARRVLFATDALPITAITLARTPTSGSIVIGGTLTVDATATDAIGGTVPSSTPVSWSVTDAAIATLTSSGARQAVVTGASAGATTISAQSEFASATTSVDVSAPVPASVVVVSGDGQSALTSTPLAQPVVVEVRDAGGTPLPGIVVTFTGPGSTTPPSATTNSSGRAQTSWTLGATAGLQQLTAQAAGGSSPSITVAATATLPAQTVALVNTPLVGVGRTATVRVTLARPAPTGGVTVTLTSGAPSNLTVSAPSSVVVNAGATTADFTVNGVATSNAVTLTATTPGYADGAVVVAVTTNTISVPPTASVPFTGSITWPITLSSAAPAGGATITVTSSDPSRVTVGSSTYVIPAGQLSVNAVLNGVAVGQTTITAQGPNFATGIGVVNVVAQLDIVQTSATLNANFSTATVTTRLLAAGTPFAAPAGGVPLTFVSRAPACIGAPTPTSVPAGQTQIEVQAGYSGPTAPTCSGYLVVTSPGYLTDSLFITVNPQPVVTISTQPTIAAGAARSMVSVSGGVAALAGGAVIRLGTSDPARARLATTNTVDAFAAGFPDSLDFTITAGSSSSTITAWLHAREGTSGSVTIGGRVVSGGYGAPADRTVTINPLGVEQFGSTSLAVPGSDGTITVYLGELTGAPTSQNVTTEQVLRFGGTPVVVTLTSTTPATAVPVVGGVAASPATVTIQPGASRVAVTPGLRGLATGTTTITATSPQAAAPVRAGYPATITVTQATSSISTNSTIAAGAARSGVSVSLSQAAPVGGVIVRLGTSDPSRLRLAESNAVDAFASLADSVDIAVNGGNSSGNTSVWMHAAENVTGAVTIGGRVIGGAFANPESRTVTVNPLGVEQFGSTSLAVPGSDGTITVYLGELTGAPTNQNVTTEQVLRFGGTPVVVTLTSTTPTTAVPVVGGVAASPATVTIQPGASRLAVTPGLRGLATGTTTITATSPQAATPVRSGYPATITVTQATSSISTNSTIAAGAARSGVSVSLSQTVAAGAPIVVRLGSSDPTRLRLAASNAVNPFAGPADSVDFTINPGSSSSSNSAWMHALEGTTGTVTIGGRVIGGDYADPPSRTITINPLGVEAFGTTSLSTLGGTGSWTAYVGELTGAPTSQNVTSEQVLRFGGPDVVVTLTSTTPTVAVPVVGGVEGASRPLTIAVGTSRASFTVRPLVAGQTTVTATSPGAATPTRSGYPATITVTAPSQSLSGPTVLGAGLAASGSVSLGVAAPAGGVTVTLTSSDPTRLLLAPDQITDGTTSITLTIGQGFSSASFVYMAREGVTGSPSVTASTPGYTDATRTQPIVEAGVQWFGTSTLYTIGPDGSGPAYIGPIQGLSGNRQVQTEQVIRFGGVARTITATSSNPAAVLPVFGGVAQNNITATIGVGQSRVTFGVRPQGTVTDSARISVIGTDLEAADAPASNVPQWVRTLVPTATPSISPTQIGAGLSVSASVSLALGVPTARSVTLTSSDPARLLLAPNATTAGTASITLDLTSGSSSASYVVMAPEGVTGQAFVTATITGYESRADTLQVVTPGVSLNGPSTTRTVTAGDDWFNAIVGVPSGGSVSAQQVRFGGPGALTVTVTASAPTVGTLAIGGVANATQTITIPVGQSQTSSVVAERLNFRPVAPGNTTISATVPGFIQTTSASRTVTVSP